jgi:multidrug efflux pump subunit AcrA (membrane-fusion protein)
MVASGSNGVFAVRLNRARWLLACLGALALSACGNDARETELREQLAQAQQEAQDAKASAAEARVAAAQAASNGAGLSDFYGSDGDGDEGFAPEPDDMPEDTDASDSFDNGADLDIPSAAEGVSDDSVEVVPEV